MKLSFIFISHGCLACMYACTTRVWSIDIRSPEAGIIDSCLTQLLGTTLGPLQEQHLLLRTKPHPTPFIFIFEKWK